MHIKDPLGPDEVVAIEVYLETLRRSLPPDVRSITFDQKEEIVRHTLLDGSTRVTSARAILATIITNLEPR